VSIPAGFQFPDLNDFVYVPDNAAAWKAFCAKYKAAACKVSEGRTFQCAFWPIFRDRMLDHGCVPIGYHFVRGTSDPVVQADNYLDWLGTVGRVGIMHDVETAGDRTNPTMSQANAFVNEVQRRTGRPRRQHDTYLPLWWWSQYGGGSTALADTMLHQSNYSSNPSMTPFAGFNRMTVLQYSDAVQGPGMSQPGDMNVAVGLSADDLIGLLGLGHGEDDMAISPEQMTQLLDAIWDVRYPRSSDVGHQTTNIKTVLDRIAEVHDQVGLVGVGVTQRSDSIDEQLAAIAAEVGVEASALAAAVAKHRGKPAAQAMSAMYAGDAVPRHAGARSETSAK